MKNRKELSALGRKAERALKDAVASVIADQKAKGIPLVVWRDGKVVEIPPEKLRVHTKNR